MKKRILIAGLIATLLLCLSPAYAALITPAPETLDEPDILSNQTGLYTYTWDADVNSGLFTARAVPLTILSGGTLANIGAPRSYDVSFYVDGSGNFLSGIGGNDLVIRGNGVDLLTGEVTNFGWFAVPGRDIALFDFTFKATGGTLADAFALGGYDLAIAEMSDFTGDWMVNHEGVKVKHDTVPVVPIPATLWLLGGGLAVLVGIRRRKVN